jgi:hypothetical protein
MQFGTATVAMIAHTSTFILGRLSITMIMLRCTDHGRGHDYEKPDEHHPRSHGTPNQVENYSSSTSQHGHWHQIISGANLHLAHQLLVVGLCEVWFIAPDAAFVVIQRKSAVSARAPPSA